MKNIKGFTVIEIFIVVSLMMMFLIFGFGDSFKQLAIMQFNRDVKSFLTDLSSVYFDSLSSNSCNQINSDYLVVEFDSDGFSYGCDSNSNKKTKDYSKLKLGEMRDVDGNVLSDKKIKFDAYQIGCKYDGANQFNGKEIIFKILSKSTTSSTNIILDLNTCSFKKNE